MKGRLKRILAILGVACMVVSSFNGISVYAEGEKANETLENQVDEDDEEQTETNLEETIADENQGEENLNEENLEDEDEENQDEGEDELTSPQSDLAIAELLPTEVKWGKAAENWSYSKDTYFTLKINSSSNDYNYTIYVFKDGEYYEKSYGFSNQGSNEGTIVRWAANSYLTEAGTYTFRVFMCDSSQGYPDDYADIANNYSDHLSAMSDELVIGDDRIQLSAPQNVKLENGVISWDPVSNADEYGMRWRKVGEESLSGNNSYSTTGISLKNCTGWLTAGVEYEFYIKALPSDVKTYINSEETVFKFTMPEITGDSADTDLATHEYIAPTNLRWDENEPGKFMFDINDSVTGYYIAEFYCKVGDSEINFHTWYFSTYLNNYVGTTETGSVISSMASSEGEYSFEVYVLGLTDTEYNALNNEYSSLDEILESGVNYVKSERSPYYKYTASSKVATVTEGSWSSDSFGTFNWIGVDHTYKYILFLYKVTKSESGEYEYSEYVTSKYTYDTTANFATYMTDSDAIYAVKIQAYSDEPEDILNSDYSEYFVYGGYSQSEAVDDANDKLSAIDNLSSESTTEAVNNAVDELINQYSDDNISNLQTAMQNDEEVLSKIDNLEKLYNEKNNIQTSASVNEEELGFTSDDVQIIGAGLNAKEANTQVKFNVEKAKPENNILFSENKYANTVQFNLDLTVGETKVNDLSVPVTITIPIPSGIDPDKLVILHESKTAPLGYELISPKISEDKTKATFTVTHFSTFAFAEAVDASNAANTISSSSNINSSNSDEPESYISNVPEAVKPLIGGTKGWDGIAKEVENAIAKATETNTTPVINIKLNDYKIIPETAVLSLAGKDVVASIYTTDGVVVGVNGKSIPTDFKGRISIASKVNADGNETVQIRNSVTDITKSATIFVKAKAGVTNATLYFVDADGKQIPFANSTVYENGYLAYVVPFVNANYIIK